LRSIAYFRVKNAQSDTSRGPTDSEFIKQIIRQHNAYRKEHGNVNNNLTILFYILLPDLLAELTVRDRCTYIVVCPELTSAFIKCVNLSSPHTFSFLY